ncbi:MAG: hypothetical protein R3D32_03405 [Nitratireductor sp.]
MTGKILVLSGYGNFGKRIVRALAAKDIVMLPDAAKRRRKRFPDPWVMM